MLAVVGSNSEEPIERGREHRVHWRPGHGVVALAVLAATNGHFVDEHHQHTNEKSHRNEIRVDDGGEHDEESTAESELE